jgi:hypothetical protein
LPTPEKWNVLGALHESFDQIVKSSHQKCDQFFLGHKTCYAADPTVCRVETDYNPELRAGMNCDLLEIIFGAIQFQCWVGKWQGVANCTLFDSARAKLAQLEYNVTLQE